MSAIAAPTTLNNAQVSTNLNFGVAAPLTWPSANSNYGSGQTAFYAVTNSNVVAGAGTAGQVSKVYANQRTADTTDTIDISTAGALVDPLNNTVGFVAVSAIIVANPNAISTNQTLTFFTSAAASPVTWTQMALNTTFSITPGNSVLISDVNGLGMTVGTTSGTLKVTSSSGSAAYDICIIGR